MELTKPLQLNFHEKLPKGSLIITVDISGPSSTTLSMVIFSRAQRALDPTVNVFSHCCHCVGNTWRCCCEHLIARRDKPQIKKQNKKIKKRLD